MIALMTVDLTVGDDDELTKSYTSYCLRDVKPEDDPENLQKEPDQGSNAETCRRWVKFREHYHEFVVESEVLSK